jgi:hypothetical protein
VGQVHDASLDDEAAQFDEAPRAFAARTKALVRHARAVDAIFDIQDRGGKASRRR